MTLTVCSVDSVIDVFNGGNGSVIVGVVADVSRTDEDKSGKMGGKVGESTRKPVR